MTKRLIDMAENSPHHGHKWMPVLYATYFGLLQEIANRHGYALAVHGSFTRDMDLIAVPWIESPSTHEAMLQEMCEMIGYEKIRETPYSSKEEKPHGRTAYTLPTGAGGYVDISIMSVFPLPIFQ